MFFTESRIRSNNNNYYDIFEFEDDYKTKFFENSKEESYLKRMDSSVPENEKEYLNIYFRADSYSGFYVREDYELLEYLGDIGGLLDFVLVMGWFISTVFVSRLFQAALVGKVYRL